MKGVRVKTWRLSPKGWPGGRLRIVALADPHACWPWMTPARLKRIVAQANALRGDLMVLLGDYPGHLMPAARVDPARVAHALSGARAEKGVFAVLGNHDWWDDPAARGGGTEECFWHNNLRDHQITLLENRHVTLPHQGGQLNLAGLGSQRAFRRKKGEFRGTHDVQAAFRGMQTSLYTILLAHEPDIFAELPDHVNLTLSGHTHGGQIRLFGRAHVVPSRYGERYAYGHVVEKGRDLIVSGGLGYSGIPVRFAMPPEITVVDLQ